MAYNFLMLIFSILSIFDVFIIKNKKRKIYILIVTLIIYLYFFGLRGFIAFDWQEYYPNFLNINPLNDFLKSGILNNGNKQFEKGFEIWVSVLKIFFNNWSFYIFFTTFIDVICLFIIFYIFSPYPIFSIFLFLGFNGLQIQLDLMRNIKAILIFLYSLKYLINNKKIPYFILNIIGVFLHRSSLIFLILTYFLRREFYKYKKSLLTFFVLGIIFLLFSNSALYEILNFIKNLFLKSNINLIKQIYFKLDYYLNSTLYSSARGIGIGFLEKIFTFVLFYAYREKINKNKVGVIFFNIYLCYISTYLYGSGVKIIFERLGLLFICSYWILYPILLKNFLGIKKILIFIFLICFCIIRMNLIYILNTSLYERYRYRNILWNSETYEERIKKLNQFYINK